MSEQNDIHFENAQCPLPFTQNEYIVMGHGSGGKMSHDLIRKIFYPCFDNSILRQGDDSGVIHINNNSGRIAFSTDSHTVQPLFFPGGDIGKLAICGTVNDLAMVGATPMALTAGFILEEGLPIAILSKIVASMKALAEEAEVLFVAGDTKVVEKGKADGVYICTSGIGLIPHSVDISGKNARPGDVILISGTIGDHGVAILSARGQLGFDSEVVSDVAPLGQMINNVLKVSNNIHVMRDPTRGGLATTLNEIAVQSNVGMIIQEDQIPIKPSVQSVCELMGFDPLYMANEGKAVFIVSKEDAEIVLDTLRQHPYGRDARIIGEVVEQPARRVLMKTSYHSTRMLEMLSGEILPRIC